MRPPAPPKRGANISPDNRFHSTQREATDDGWWHEEATSPVTELLLDHAKTVITHNDSPDVPFEHSINPYRGCEHGCAYCFARPSHAYLDLSPGLDFETKILHKPDAPELLRRELAHPHYRCAPIAVGPNTDPYQPVERDLGLTRRILEVLAAHRHPLALITKSALVVRDRDILSELARHNLVRIAVSITTLDGALARRLEPRAATPAHRLRTIEALAQAGIPVTVLAAPMIPKLNDHELEAILAAARDAGATGAGYVSLRLPYELDDIFTAWLAEHAPLKKEAVLHRIALMRGGKLNEARFGSRMRGKGPWAELMAQRLKLTLRRLGFGHKEPPLETTLFRVPGRPRQEKLFR